MTTIHWKSGISGYFDVGANWSIGTAPGSLDDALIDAGGTYTVTTSSATTVHSLGLTSGITFDITRGEFTSDFFGITNTASAGC